MRFLENGVNPENILCITFTEKAKKEMFEKIIEMTKGRFPDSEITKLNIHTFHGFVFNYLVDAGLITREITESNAMRFALLESYENNKAFNYGKDYLISEIVPKSGPSKTSFIDKIVQAILESSGIDIKKELVEESLRVDFVAFTRAKEKLIIITDDKDKGKYYIENLSEIEIDSNAENSIVTKIDSRLSEAFSLFIAGRFEDSKKLLKKEDGWLEQFIINYFKNITHLSYSSVTTKPYEFLLKNIIKKPFVSDAAEFVIFSKTVYGVLLSNTILSELLLSQYEFPHNLLGYLIWYPCHGTCRCSL